MPETAVADTGPLLHLVEIGQERTLALFESLAISGQVKDELAQADVYEAVASALGDRMRVERVSPGELDAQRAILSTVFLSDRPACRPALRPAVRPADEQNP